MQGLTHHTVNCQLYIYVICRVASMYLYLYVVDIPFAALAMNYEWMNVYLDSLHVCAWRGPSAFLVCVLAPTSRHAAASKLKWKVSGSASTEFSAAGPNVPPTRQTMYNSDTPGPKFSRRLTRHNCHNVFTALKSYNKQGTHFYALVITLRTFVLHRSMVSKIAAMWGDVSRSRIRVRFSDWQQREAIFKIGQIKKP